MTKIAVAVPSHDRWHAEFGFDLVRLFQAWGGPVDDYELELVQVTGTYLPQARELAVRYARSIGAEHILWLDCDMRFPPDALHRLLASGRKIIGANYPTRRPPHRWTGHATKPVGATFPGLAEADMIGFGCLLTDIVVFHTPSGMPRFHTPWAPGPDGVPTMVGEDASFCKLVMADGFKVWIDDTLSQEVRHIGQREFGPADIGPAAT